MICIGLTKELNRSMKEETAYFRSDVTNHRQEIADGTLNFFYLIVAQSVS